MHKNPKYRRKINENNSNIKCGQLDLLILNQDYIRELANKEYIDSDLDFRKSSKKSGSSNFSNS